MKDLVIPFKSPQKGLQHSSMALFKKHCEQQFDASKCLSLSSKRAISSISQAHMKLNKVLCSNQSSQHTCIIKR